MVFAWVLSRRLYVWLSFFSDLRILSPCRVAVPLLLSSVKKISQHVDIPLCLTQHRSLTLLLCRQWVSPCRIAGAVSSLQVSREYPYTRMFLCASVSFEVAGDISQILHRWCSLFFASRVCNRSARARSTPLDRVDRLNVGPTNASDRSDRLPVGHCWDLDRSDRL
jgi:hypothetical protein